MTDMPQFEVVNPLSDAERESLDEMLSALLLPEFSSRERAIARKVARAVLKLTKKWRPMDSAPKDGRPVILRFSHPVMARWVNGRGWVDTTDHSLCEPSGWFPVPTD